MKIVLTVIFVILMTGCNKLNLHLDLDSIGINLDKEGWKSSQKREFLGILKTDKYMSICDDASLYETVRRNKNSKLMSKMLISYANNLANSCINIPQFEASQHAKKVQKIETHFSLNTQKVDEKAIMAKLRAGESIENILAPYVPKGAQFSALISKYRSLLQTGENPALAQKIRLNIERTKLMPTELGTNYVLVNIPEFKVRLFEGDKKSIEFRTIVGKTNMQTPVFSAKLQYVMVNPQWNVPDSITRKSYIAKMKANPNWLASQGMELHTSYDLKSPKVNPASVDWSKYPKGKKGYIPYKIIQKPSLHNSLGRVKFMFPNQYSVYMHDTQSKGLFNRNVRAYSHGCIRLQKPKTLLDYVTIHYTAQNVPTVHKWYNSRKTHILKVNRALPVHTAYFTTYVDTDGKLHIFGDIYGFDSSQKLTF
ncbi:MAG: L,D-transpeptidase [Sulfurovum sp.]|nr:MAG: L,D-transpeptidase [Sulfurovum sp.]